MTAAAFADLTQLVAAFKAQGVTFMLGKMGNVVYDTAPMCQITAQEIVTFRNAHQVDLAALLAAEEMSIPPDEILKRFGWTRWMVEMGAMSETPEPYEGIHVRKLQAERADLVRQLGEVNLKRDDINQAIAFKDKQIAAEKEASK